MKNFCIIIIAIFISQSSSAQQKILTASDLKNGKYFVHSNTDQFVGTWASPDKSFITTISTNVKHLQKGDVNIKTDIIVVKFEKFTHNKNDIALVLVMPIELYASANSITYRGEYDDPITKNKINLILKYIDKNKLQIFRTSSILGDDQKGTIFPLQIDLVPSY